MSARKRDEHDHPEGRKIRDLLKQRPFRSILIKPKVFKAMTVAGSDPSGGAGIQADLKTFTNFEVYGCAAITALTAQNTRGVGGIVPVEPDFIRRQVEMVLEDLGPMPVKTGMLADGKAVEAVIDCIDRHGLGQVVVDPVLVATSQDSLVLEDTRDALRRLIGKALLVTPNLEEAQALTGKDVHDAEGMREAALEIHRWGVRNVLIKGGHLTDDATDLFFDGAEFTLLTEKRIPGGQTHGTGCSYSAAITSGLAKGMTLLDAVINGKIFITRALKFALEVGGGARVLNFFI